MRLIGMKCAYFGHQRQTLPGKQADIGADVNQADLVAGVADHLLHESRLGDLPAFVQQCRAPDDVVAGKMHADRRPAVVVNAQRGCLYRQDLEGLNLEELSQYANIEIKRTRKPPENMVERQGNRLAYCRHYRIGHVSCLCFERNILQYTHSVAAKSLTQAIGCRREARLCPLQRRALIRCFAALSSCMASAGLPKHKSLIAAC